MRTAERVYDRLLGLYPERFLREYREPMRQAFRDQLRGAGTLRRQIHLWLRTLADLGRSVPAAWFARTRQPVSRFAFENWNPRARRAVFFARMAAMRSRSETITVEILLAGLLNADVRLASALLPNDSQAGIAAALGITGEGGDEPKGASACPLDSSCAEVLNLARTEMLGQNRKNIEPAHIILAILGRPDTPAAVFLGSRDVNAAKVRAVMRDLDG